jgi:hypothetical protein
MEYKKKYYSDNFYGDDNSHGVDKLWDNIFFEIMDINDTLKMYSLDKEFFSYYEKLFKIAKVLDVLDITSDYIILWKIEEVNKFIKELEIDNDIKFSFDENNHFYIWTYKIKDYNYQLLLSKDTELLFVFNEIGFGRHYNLVQNKVYALGDLELWIRDANKYDIDDFIDELK